MLYCNIMAEGAFLFFLITGMLGFSSAFLCRDNFPHPNPGIISETMKEQKRRSRVLYVLTDYMDAGANSNMEKSEGYLIGQKDSSDKDKHDTKNILTFQSSFQRQSIPLGHLSPGMTLDEFLLHPDHLLSSGKSIHSKIVPTTIDLLEDWKIACDHVGACPPNVDHGVIMSVRTAGISIPGLTVEWSALIGTNLVYRTKQDYQQEQGHHQHQHPELEFVLIEDENKVSSGAKPIVWIFNKLSQSRSDTSQGRNKRQRSTMSTKLFTRLGFYEDNDGSNSESMVIRCAGTMEMKFRIPSMVGNLIFSSDAESQKSQAERKISNLITRQIEKDTEQNILSWEENFRSWISAADEHERGQKRDTNKITD